MKTEEPGLAIDWEGFGFMTILGFMLGFGSLNVFLKLFLIRQKHGVSSVCGHIGHAFSYPHKVKQ